MKEFSEYLLDKSVKKQRTDPHTARATAKAAWERIELAHAIFTTQKPKFVVENAFESIQELIDAVLFSKGYKSYSHEGSIAYLQEMRLTSTDIGKADMLRKQRNGIKYYGDDATEEQARQALTIAEDLMGKIALKEPAVKQG